MTDPIQPEFELVPDFMPVLVTSKFDEDSIKNERASLPFSHYKSMGNFLDPQGHLTPKRVARSGRKSNSSKILCLTLLPAKFDKDQIKTEVLAWRYLFPLNHFCYHGNHSFDGICSKT